MIKRILLFPIRCLGVVIGLCALCIGFFGALIIEIVERLTREDYENRV